MPSRTEDLGAISTALGNIAESLSRIADHMRFQSELMASEAVRNGHNVSKIPK